MPRACRRNLILRVVTAAAVLTGSFLSGCGRSKPETMSLGDWIAVLDDKAGIHQFDSDTPYYMNVGHSSPYYESVQAAVEWKVLDPGAAFDPNAALTREWTAYTLMNLRSTELKSENSTKIRDISKSRFPKHVGAAVGSGLMSLDHHERFRPQESMDRLEALSLLEQVVQTINNRRIEEPSLTFDWGDQVDFAKAEPEEIDMEEETALFSEDAPITPGQYFSTYTPYHASGISGALPSLENGTAEKKEQESEGSEDDSNRNESSGSSSEEGKKEPDLSNWRIWKINEIETDPETGKQKTKIEPAQPEDVFDSLNAAQSFTIDFSQAEIIDAIDGTVIQEAPVSYTQNSSVSLMAARANSYTKNHTINGYEISYTVSSSEMKATVSKKTKGGLQVTGSFIVTDVTPAYELDMNHLKVDNGYFRVDFKSIESLAVEGSSYKEFYGDFSKVNPRDFLGTVKNAFQEKKENSELEVPLAVINVPVPYVPALTVSLQMQLKLSADGKAKLTLSQDHSLGMEIRDGKMRDISTSSNKAEVTLHANTALKGGMKLSVKAIEMSIADITAEAGAQADVTTTVHAYDKNGNHAVMSDSQVPSDLAEELAEGNGNVLTCADLKAYKVADIQLNSGKSLLGKLGLSATVPLINGDNAPLFPGMKTHMENGHFVDKCTRKDRLKTPENDKVVVSDQIRISSYSMILNPGESREITVTALPKGYSVSDLIFASERPEIASVSGGVVTAGKDGSGIIRIRTRDGKFEVSCTVLVRKKK